MGQQTRLQYCEISTRTHPCALEFETCVQEIGAICKAEGARSNPFNHEICINLDAVEENRAKRHKTERQKTMDLCFAVKNGKTKMVLVELRLNYNNVKNIREREMRQKIDCSRGLIKHEPTILDKYFFVFRTNIIHQAESRLRRFNSNRSNWVGLDLNRLKKLFF